MKKAFRAAAIAAILLFALTFIESAKIKSASAHLLFSSSVSVGGNESREVTLKSGDRIAIGSYLGEPIVWSVIKTGNKTLLMSEKVLCFRAVRPVRGRHRQFRLSRLSPARMAQFGERIFKSGEFFR